MSTNIEYRHKVKIFPLEKSVDEFVATEVISQLNLKLNSVISIATGNSTKNVQQILVNEYQKGKVDFSNVVFFGLDEYWSIKPNHPISTAKRMREQFFDQVNFQQGNIYFPNGTAKDLEGELDRWRKIFYSYGNLDLAVLGIGPGKTCHLGLNNPPSSSDSKIRYVEINPESRQAMVEKLSLSADEIPEGGITLGMTEILAAKSIILIAKGKDKAWGIFRSLKGKIGPDAPASFLRYHPEVIVVLDKEASAKL